MSAHGLTAPAFLILVVAYVVILGSSLILKPESICQPLGVLSLVSALVTIYLLNYFYPLKESLSKLIQTNKPRLFRFGFYGICLVLISVPILFVIYVLTPKGAEGVSMAGSLAILYKFIEWLWKRTKTIVSKIIPRAKELKTIDASFNQTESISGILLARFPLRLDEDDSTTLEVTYRTAYYHKDYFPLCKLTMPIPGELRVELQAAAFDIAGDQRQNISLEPGLYRYSESFVWNLSPKRSGKHLINLVISIQNSCTIKEIFQLRMRVIKLFGLTAKQIRVVTYFFGALAGLLAIANTTRQLGLW